MFLWTTRAAVWFVLCAVADHCGAYGFVSKSARRTPSCRRECRSKFVSFASIDGSSEIQEQLQPDDSSLLEASCPFSKAYPRYRIDLTSSKKQQETNNLVPSFLTNMQASWAKSNFEKQYTNTRSVWIEETSPVQVFASLWRWAASLADESSSSNGSCIILGYPKGNDNNVGLVVQRWIDIMEWLEEQQQPEVATKIRATILKEESRVAIVQIDCIKVHTTAGKNPSQAVDPPVDGVVMEKQMKAWVKRVLVDLGICPFTKSVTKSGQGLADLGVPVGRIAYHSSSASRDNIYRLMADTWEAISDMLDVGPSGKLGISSILLAAPYFDDDFDLWSGPIFAMLEAGVLACQAEQDVGVVCFHPKYATPDGSSFPGFGHMHSVPRLQQWMEENTSDRDVDSDLVAAGGAWQRRTPHATINVLRADQLEAAESKRNSGKMYTENINKLVGVPNGIGSIQLAKDLRRERQMGTAGISQEAKQL